MIRPKIIFFLILVTGILAIVPVSANPWTNFQKIDTWSDAPTVSEMTWNSIPDTSSSLNDPFQSTYTQYSSSVDIPRINPFDNYALNTLSDMPSTTSYDFSLDDQVRQMKYSSALSSQDQIMNKMYTESNIYAGTTIFDSMYGAAQPFGTPDDYEIDQIPTPIRTNLNNPPYSLDTTYDASGYPTSTSLGFAGDSFVLNSLDPTGSLGKINSLSKAEFQYLGYSTQIMSPPPIEASKYTSTQFGPYGVLGGQATATSDITMDTVRIRQSDQIYTTGIYESGRQMDHFYTERIDYTNTPITGSPGVTATGYSSKESYFYTPLGSGPGAWVGSRFETTFPNTGYDPSTDIGYVNYNQRITYTQNIEPGGLSGYNTMPTMNYNTIPDYNYNIPSYSNYNMPRYSNYNIPSYSNY